MKTYIQEHIYSFLTYCGTCLLVVVQEHPELVNPVTGYVNMIRVMKYFPHMTQSYVSIRLVQYDQYYVKIIFPPHGYIE